MNNTTSQLIVDIANEWNPQFRAHSPVFLYGDNAYLLGITTIEIYFDEFMVVAGHNMFKCYSRISRCLLQCTPNDINIQSVEKNIRDLFDNFTDSQLYIGIATQGEVFTLLKK